VSKAFKAWFKTQTFIPQGDYAYAEMAWDAAVEATKEKAAKLCEELHKQAHPLGMIYPKDCAAAIRSMK
jgi:hypothetical protein